MQDRRPSVFVMNHANAHTAKLQVCTGNQRVLPVMMSGWRCSVADDGGASCVDGIPSIVFGGWGGVSASCRGSRCVILACVPPVDVPVRTLRCRHSVGLVLECVLVFAGRPGISTPSRLIWLSAPYTFCQSRKANTYMTTARTASMSGYSAGVMRGMGFPIADVTQVTQSRWDAAYDGLHYAARGGDDHWLGAVSGMNYQVVLNVMFPTCLG